MSGTSLDGVDSVLARFSAASAAHPPEVLAFASRPMPGELRRELLALQTPGANELHRSALAANALARLQAEVVQALLAQTGTAAHAVRAIGSHGQTLRHQPSLHDGIGYTLQINQPALIAELTGIDVIADFRTRDVAAGGQGAPLVPAFHARCFTRADAPVAVLNLGGIANLTLLPALATQAPPQGFDCGPGNVLLDAWAQRHLGQPFDAGGAWAADGQVDAGLLQHMLAEPFIAQPPPKSTGRDLFNIDWLEAQLRHLNRSTTPAADIQATLLAFTVTCVTGALRRFAPPATANADAPARRLWVCGGGAANTALMHALQADLGPAWGVASTAEAGMAPQVVEAAAFAWLAHAHLLRQPGQSAAITGARGPRVLGALYPAR